MFFFWRLKIATWVSLPVPNYLKNTPSSPKSRYQGQTNNLSKDQSAKWYQRQQRAWSADRTFRVRAYMWPARTCIGWVSTALGRLPSKELVVIPGGGVGLGHLCRDQPPKINRQVSLHVCKFNHLHESSDLADNLVFSDFQRLLIIEKMKVFSSTQSSMHTIIESQ